MRLEYGTANETLVCIWMDKQDWIKKISSDKKKLEQLVTKLGTKAWVSKNSIGPAQAVVHPVIGELSNEPTWHTILATADQIFKVMYTTLFGFFVPKAKGYVDLRGRVSKVIKTGEYSVIYISIEEIGTIPIITGPEPNICLENGNVVEAHDVKIYVVNI